MQKLKLACLALCCTLLLMSCGAPTTNIGYNTTCGCESAKPKRTWQCIDEGRHYGRTIQKIYYSEATETIYIITYIHEQNSQGNVFMVETITETYNNNGEPMDFEPHQDVDDRAE